MAIVSKDTPYKMTPDELVQFMDMFGLNESELANTIAVTKGAVLHWREGRREIPPTVVRLLQYFIRHPELIGEF